MKNIGTIKPFKNKVWLSSPTMHGEELAYMTEAYETNWMSTVGANIDAIEKDAINLSRICNCELLYISCFEGQLFRIGICQHGEKLTEYLDDREGSCVISVLNNNQMNYFFRFPVSLLQWSSLKGNQICSVLQSIMQKELF